MQMKCVDGEGWYQEDGKDAQSLKPGTVVTIPAGVKHWHGAKADTWFSHLAVECPGVDTSNEWLEPVTDELQPVHLSSLDAWEVFFSFPVPESWTRLIEEIVEISKEIGYHDTNIAFS